MAYQHFFQNINQLALMITEEDLNQTPNDSTDSLQVRPASSITTGPSCGLSSTSNSGAATFVLSPSAQSFITSTPYDFPSDPQDCLSQSLLVELSGPSSSSNHSSSSSASSLATISAASSSTSLTTSSTTNSLSSSMPSRPQRYRRASNSCSFCITNNEPLSVASSHQLRDPTTNEVTCPVLFKYTCPLCNATGANAHTRSYCPLARAGRQSVLGSSPLFAQYLTNSSLLTRSSNSISRRNRRTTY